MAVFRVESIPICIQNVASSVVCRRADRPSNGLDDRLCSLQRIPPLPAIHPLLYNLVSKVRIWDFADNLKSAQVVLQIDAFLHRRRDEDSWLLAVHMLAQLLKAVLGAVE